MVVRFEIWNYSNSNCTPQVNDDWSAQQAPVQASDWAAESTGQPQMGAGAAQWGGSSNWA